MPKVAYSYERVSSTRQARLGGGIDRQQDAAALWCEGNDYQLDNTLDLTDRGMSAYSGKHLTKGTLGRFLSLAKEDRLGVDPVLLAEDVDRLSRMEPLDGLLDIFGALIRAGVTIVTLMDGSVYSRQTINEDSSKLIVLVVKIQEAHRFSQKLGKRGKAAHEQARKKIAEGQAVKRKCPFWISWDKSTQGWKLNDKADTVRRLFELMFKERLGLTLTARKLNEEGHKSARGAAFNHSTVQHIVTRETTIGALVMNDGTRKDDYYPPVVEPAVRAAVLQMMEGRKGDDASRGRRKDCHYIGQSLTFCAICGGVSGVSTSTGRDGKPHRYVRCRNHLKGATCQQKGLPIQLVASNLLTRLTLNQLSDLWPETSKAQSSLSKEAEAIKRLGGELEETRSKRDRFKERVDELALDGSALSLLKTMQDRVDSEDERADEIAASLKAAEGRLALLQSQPSPQRAVAEMEPLIKELFVAMLKEEDTAEQRWGLNRLLENLGLRIHLDGNARTMGLQINDGPIKSAPISDLAIWAMGRGVTSAEYSTNSDGIRWVDYPLTQEEKEELQNHVPHNNLTDEEHEMLRRVFNK